MNSSPEHLFDQRVSIQRQTTAPDAQGSPVVTWSTSLTDIKAAVQPRAGSVGEHQGRTAPQQRYRVYLTGSVDVRPGDRLVWAGRVLAIHSVRNVGVRNVLLTLDALETK
jgi:head-tail adaptor